MAKPNWPRIIAGGHVQAWQSAWLLCDREAPKDYRAHRKLVKARKVPRDVRDMLKGLKREPMSGRGLKGFRVKAGRTL